MDYGIVSLGALFNDTPCPKRSPLREQRDALCFPIRVIREIRGRSERIENRLPHAKTPSAQRIDLDYGIVSLGALFNDTLCPIRSPLREQRDALCFPIRANPRNPWSVRKNRRSACLTDQPKRVRSRDAGRRVEPRRRRRRQAAALQGAEFSGRFRRGKISTSLLRARVPPACLQRGGEVDRFPLASVGGRDR
jgi:hypothetical protein